MSLLLSIGFRIDGAIWRALLVAALALVAFALVRYWQSLFKYPRDMRFLLVALRGASLLLLACACAGLGVEYEAAAPPRVLVYQAKPSSAMAQPRAGVSSEALKQITSSLKAKNLEVVEQAEAASISEESTQYGAAIFLTDGAVRAEDARRLVEQASAAAGGAPVYVLTDLQGSDGGRVALDNIAVLNRSVRGVPLAVRCLVHARGMRGRSTLVTISDEAQVRASAQVSWTADDEQQALTLEVVPKTDGWIDYVARVEGAGGEVEATLSRSFTVYAEERRQRVLFFEGEPTWEAKFIRRALEEAELFDVDYFAQVSKIAIAGVKEQAMEGSQEPASKKQTDESAKAGEAASAPEARLRAVLASAARLNSYDCIIVGATPDAMLSATEAGRLRDWVERRGGGLVILGGNSFAGSVVAQNGKLAALLPAQVDAGSFRSDAQAVAGSTPVEAEKSTGHLSLTPTAAGASGALHGYLSASEGKEKPSVLTGQGLRLSTLRAGATALAVAGQTGADGTSEAGTTLLAAMRYGAGRAIVFAPADSWRIRTSASGEEAEKGGAFAALWQGIALWAASGSRPPVEIALSDDSPAAGSLVTAEIRARDEAYAPAKIEKLRALLQPLPEDAAADSDAAQAPATETPAQELAFAPDASDESLWRARFNAPARGRFSLIVDYTASGKSGTAEKYFATVRPTALAAGESRDALQRLARQTGGDLYTAADLNELSEKLHASPHTRQSLRRTWQLRTWWPLALIIPLLLSGEWLILRLREKG